MCHLIASHSHTRFSMTNLKLNLRYYLELRFTTLMLKERVEIYCFRCLIDDLRSKDKEMCSTGLTFLNHFSYKPSYWNSLIEKEDGVTKRDPNIVHLWVYRIQYIPYRFIETQQVTLPYKI